MPSLINFNSINMGGDNDDNKTWYIGSIFHILHYTNRHAGVLRTLAIRTAAMFW